MKRLLVVLFLAAAMSQAVVAEKFSDNVYNVCINTYDGNYRFMCTSPLEVEDGMSVPKGARFLVGVYNSALDCLQLIPFAKRDDAEKFCVSFRTIVFDGYNVFDERDPMSLSYMQRKKEALVELIFKYGGTVFNPRVLEDGQVGVVSETYE